MARPCDTGFFEVLGARLDQFLHVWSVWYVHLSLDSQMATVMAAMLLLSYGLGLWGYRKLAVLPTIIFTVTAANLVGNLMTTPVAMAH